MNFLFLIILIGIIYGYLTQIYKTISGLFLYIYLILVLAIELGGRLLSDYVELNLLYQIIQPVYFCMIAGMYMYEKKRNWFYLINVGFLSFYLVNLFFLQVNAFTKTYGMLAYQLLISLLAIKYLLSLVKDENLEQISDAPLFFVSFGLLIYCGGTIFFYAILNNLNEQFIITYSNLLMNSILGYNFVLYSMIVINLWVQSRIFVRK